MDIFKINSKMLSKNPSSITHSQTRVQSSDRTMDGTLVIDIIAIKDVVNVEWKILSIEDMQKLTNELTGGGFVTIDYLDSTTNGEFKNVLALPGNLSYLIYYDYRTDSILWKDVKISFTER